MYISNSIMELLRRKAMKSKCMFRVAAMAFDAKGTVLGTAMNTQLFPTRGGSMHAERKLIIKYGRKISQIVICRTNKMGDFLSIDPCANCRKIADNFGIEILSIKPINQQGITCKTQD